MVNCTGSCPHFVYTKNGVVMREEQSKDMPKLNGVPEYNPRGCNKGECATDYIYSSHRIKYPLIRVGERGEGKWRRVSWDEALEYVANGIVDTLKNDASDCISVYTPVPAVSPVSSQLGIVLPHLSGGIRTPFLTGTPTILPVRHRLRVFKEIHAKPLIGITAEQS